MLLRILPYARPYWKRIAAIAVMIATMAALRQVEPYITKRITDTLIDGITGESFSVLTLLGILLITKLIISALNRASWHLTNLFAVTFESHLKQTGFDHLLNLSIGFFNDQASGKMMSKLDRGVNRLVTIVNNSGMHFLPSVTTALISLVIVTSVEWKITASILLAFIPYVLINRWRFERNSQLERQEYKLYDRQYSHFWEVLNAMALIKSFRAEVFERRRLKTFFEKYLGLRQEMERNTDKAFIGDVFLETWNWAMYAYIVWMTWQGQITVGTLVFLVGMIQLIREPLWQLNWIFWEVKRAGIGARDFFRIMDVEPDIADPAKPQHLPKRVRGEITFDNVSFTYQNRSQLKDVELQEDQNDADENEPAASPQEVFEGLTFTLEAGKTTALVGPSGAGKSTVAQLVLRFFDPDAGRVLLDGIDIRHFKQSELRQQIGFVAQDPYLFADTIRENLRYAKPNATDKEMWHALELAYAAEFIKTIPQGLETFIGDRGVKLSGGQRQRLSLARTILSDPKIIILDEATSALDSESEMYIQKALQQVLKDRTAIVIAHRLSTIQRADNIIVLKDRRVLEQGTHQELLQQGGLYSSLFTIQSGGAQTLKEWELVA